MSLPPNIYFYDIQLSNYIFNNGSTFMSFLPGFLSLYPGKIGLARFVRQTCWSVFRARTVLSFIYSVALPWSSISHFHCWCWCHFSNASMGTGICMTPPLPQVTTNSSFNTSTKCPVRHPVFEFVTFVLVMLNIRTFVSDETLFIYETNFAIDP